MRRTLARAPRRTAGLLTAAVMCLMMSGGTSPAGAQEDGTGLESNQCAVFMMWPQSIHSPALGSPYSGYPVFAPNPDAATADLDNTAFVISQDFPYTAYGGWFLYPAPSLLPDRLHLPADEGRPGERQSVHRRDADPCHEPALPHDPTADSVTELAPNLAEIANKTTWAAGNNAWFVLGRNYNAFAGYQMSGTGGPTNTAWPESAPTTPRPENRSRAARPSGRVTRSRRSRRGTRRVRTATACSRIGCARCSRRSPAARSTGRRSRTRTWSSSTACRGTARARRTTPSRPRRTTAPTTSRRAWTRAGSR